ncbi:DUF6023 family protein [Actinoplanes sp. NPDC051633]|uniref:DUF6023 family protein n=1 Tax=Actinoplanes sp. NPDC051633 TaxID=3155670 RepID=UPI0034395D15
MTEERSRGVVLYTLTGLLLAGGGVWFVRSAPETGTDPRLAAWQETAEQVLPDQPLQADAETIVLRGDLAAERSNPVESGFYALSMICVGAGHVRVRVSAGGNDSGLAVPCVDKPARHTIEVGLATKFYLQVTPEENAGTAVFRWQLRRTNRN